MFGNREASRDIPGLAQIQEYSAYLFLERLRGPSSIDLTISVQSEVDHLACV
jgi:hypothetical protein